MQHYKNPYLVHFGTFAPDGPGRPGGNEFTPLGPLDKNDIVLLQRNELKERRRGFELKMESLEHDYANLHNMKFRASRPHHTKDDVQKYIQAKQLYDAKIKDLVDAMEEFKNLASHDNNYQEVPASNEQQQDEWMETLNEYKI